MVESYKTILEGGSAEIVIKKSRFIASIQPVETEEEAIAFIEGLKKTHWNAAHNCSAYIIGNTNPILRCSDDGEPSKTAGKPMLDILINHELTNLVVVVTRYFGGTLLGTGGLVKAYQSATLEGLSHCIQITKELGQKIQIITDYNLIGKIQYYVNQESIPILSSTYTDIVTIELLVRPSIVHSFNKKIAELTNGTASMIDGEQVYFTILDHEIHLFL